MNSKVLKYSWNKKITVSMSYVIISSKTPSHNDVSSTDHKDAIRMENHVAK